MDRLLETYTYVSNLYDNLILIVNIEKGIIDRVVNNSAIVATNISYKEFSEMFMEYYNLDEDSKDKIIRFFNGFNPSREHFVINPNFKNKNGETVRLELRGYKYDSSNAILSFTPRDTQESGQFDDLTKILTRDGIQPMIHEFIESSNPFALIFLDIDDFDDFNDKYGKIYGDIVLLEVSAVIKDFIKSDGYVARIGADRFLILIKIEDDFDYIHTLCTALRNTVISMTNHNIKQAQITATIGCATFPHDGLTYEEIYQKAYLALERGKKKGKNCFIIYTAKKCGIPDKLVVAEKRSLESNKANNFNIISGIYEILNRKNSINNNILDALTLIGNFYMLDRIVIHRINPNDKEQNISTTSWTNPRANLKLITTNSENIAAWKKTFDKTGLIKINQVESNKNIPIYDSLTKSNVSSIVACRLQFNGLDYGAIRYEMCKETRYWKEDSVAALMVIAKIFTIVIKNELEKAEFNYQMSYDSLTNIFNFTKFNEEVNKILAQDISIDYSIASLNLYNYSQLTEKFGLHISEYAIRQIATGLMILSEQEMYCRLNNDNFYIFFRTDDIDQVTEYLDNLTSFVANRFPQSSSYHIVAGVAVGNNTNDVLTNIIDNSNVALKKATPSNSVVPFNESLYNEQKSKFELELHQEEALLKNEFLLYLQPKINTTNEQIVGAEALVRWNYNHEKLLFPNDFIPLFEENNFIIKLDLYMFEKVCIFQRRMLDNNIKPVTISVNLSMAQKDLEKYVYDLNLIRNKYQVPAEYLEIEITESIYINNIEAVCDLIKDLKQYGYKISMDDFGSGYSSLSSLATFEFDVIKLDKKFVDKLDDKNKIILGKIIELVTELNIKVLCEGVETKNLIDFLSANGCNIVQGYFYDKPLPEEVFEKKYMIKK